MMKLYFTKKFTAKSIIQIVAVFFILPWALCQWAIYAAWQLSALFGPLFGVEPKEAFEALRPTCSLLTDWKLYHGSYEMIRNFIVVAFVPILFTFFFKWLGRRLDKE